MFQLVQHTQIDLERWNNTVMSSAFPSLFAQSFFLDAVAPGWDALVWGDYQTVFPLCSKRKYGIPYLPQPLFTGQLGLFGKIDPERETALYAYLKKTFRLVEYELNCMHKLNPDGFRTMRTFVIDYNKPIVYNQNTKRNISKARQLGLSVTLLDQAVALKHAHLYLDPFLSTNLGFGTQALAVFHHLLKACSEQGKLHSLQVNDERGDVRAIAHFVISPSHVVYLKGTNLDKTENSGSMHLLMHHAIMQFKQEDRIFDFAGGTIQGIGNFFKGLGGEELKYPKFMHSSLPGWTSWIRRPEKMNKP
ncbi:MAG TPA: hypothetical protein PLQ93_08675 [Bacteroidia bacterium]|nr:hypothetical protein [Bacteroidia bacterium]